MFENTFLEETKKILAYTIKDIAEWQADLPEFNNEVKSHNSHRITLPSLQRGFVWKSYQIESLWDSILRGYPIGSVLMSNTDNCKELLDGQQRSTSIALGFYNPFTDGSFSFFHAKNVVPVVWIDFKELESNKYGLKFGIRVLTKSHPWGYQLSDHRSILNFPDREKALEAIRKSINNEKLSFTKIENQNKVPWDTFYPVPLSVLLKSNSDKFEIWKAEVERFISEYLGQIKTKHSQGSDFVNYSEINVDQWHRMYTAILRAKRLLIPEIILDNQILNEVDVIRGEENNDANSTLFIRLNSEGTRITGEELVYSLFKAVFPESKKLVEDIGFSFVPPSKVINLISRVIITKSNDSFTYQNDLGINNFRQQIGKAEFKDTLRHYVIDSNQKSKNLFEKAIKIITLNKEIPPIFYREVILNSLDLFYVLLVYLENNTETIENIDQNLIHKTFITLSKFGSKDKDVARKLFDDLKTKQNQFTNWELSCRSVVENFPNLCPPLPTPENLRSFLIDKILKDYVSSTNNSHFNDFDFIKQIVRNNSDELDFLFKIFDNYPENAPELSEEDKLNKAVEYWKMIIDRIYKDRSFIIVAQSEYFKNEFTDFIEFESVEDTNRPWDWDHIYPNSWVYSRHKISQKVRWIVNLNGNFRALSFNENRRENNLYSPKERISKENGEQICKNAFISSSADKEFWLLLDENAKPITVNDTKKIEILASAIFYRMEKMYNVFYNNFAF